MAKGKPDLSSMTLSPSAEAFAQAGDVQTIKPVIPKADEKASETPILNNSAKPIAEGKVSIKKPSSANVKKKNPVNPARTPKQNSLKEQVSLMPENRVQSPVRLPISATWKIKEIALNLTKKTGTRVTAQDIMERAIMDFLKKEEESVS